MSPFSSCQKTDLPSRIGVSNTPEFQFGFLLVLSGQAGRGLLGEQLCYKPAALVARGINAEDGGIFSFYYEFYQSLASTLFKNYTS